MTISVILVDDHEVVRAGLETLLGRRDELDVVAVVGTGEEAVAAARESRPDVVVMDVRLPGESGIEACREILDDLPATRVLMLTTYADEDAVLASVLAGASGYLLKDTSGADLADAIRLVASGASLLDPAITGVVLSRLKAEEGVSGAALAPRDRQILELIAHGKTNGEIGRELYLAEGTVRNHVSQILTRLGVGSRAEAAARFAREEPKAE